MSVPPSEAPVTSRKVWLPPALLAVALLAMLLLPTAC
ncbi:MAG: hypothetical protein ACI90M_004679, partial [Candidatus Azotimanducaceae bacterium]